MEMETNVLVSPGGIAIFLSLACTIRQVNQFFSFRRVKKKYPKLFLFFFFSSFWLLLCNGSEPGLCSFLN